jgi:non-specific serine/threonine protein kinase
METLRVSLLGSFQVRLNGQPITQFYSQKAQLLLAYLILYRRTHPRSVLAHLFWGEHEEARAQASLRNALYSLRKMLSGAPNQEFIVSDGTSIRFNTNTDYALDVEQFDKTLAAASRAKGTERATLLQQALALYEGDLLTGSYDDWILIEQEHLKDTYVQALTQLTRWCEETGEHKRAIDWTRRALLVRPLQEELHRTLMRCYFAVGDRAAALQAYETCASLLKKELKIGPEPQTHRLYEEILQGKIAESDRAASPALPQHNLPRPVTSFVGRKSEIGEIKQLLTISRLLTLSGPGGCGKTRLALESATELIEKYTHGIWFVDLTALRNPELVPQAIATVLGVRETQGQPLMAALTDFCQQKEMLLILDNCEHLVDACAKTVETLLQKCAQIRILATSRELLQVAGEMVWKTAPLLLPDLQSLPAAGPALTKILSDYEAIQLFCERAQSHVSGFAIDTQNALAIAQICHYLDGLPLAIELAAARIKTLSTQQIEVCLQQSIEVLVQESRAALPKHQTLRATLDWSYELLNEKEQILLTRLSVFSGGFILWAVEGVCAGDGIKEFEVLDLLTQLTNKSLIRVVNQQGKVRYHLLETVKLYGAEKLQQAREETEVRNKHLRFFLSLAERAEPELINPSEATWPDRLEAEHNNLRAAINWSLESSATAAGLQLTAALSRFWSARGYTSEGRHWLEKALSEGHHEPESLRAKALIEAGTLAWNQGDFTQATTYHQQSLLLYRGLGDEQGMAYALNHLGVQSLDQGEYEQAIPLLQESLKIFRKLNWKRGISLALGNIAIVTYNQGDVKQAQALLEESLVLCRENNDKDVIGTILGSLGFIARDQGDYGLARALHEEQLAIARAIGNKVHIARALHDLGSVAREQMDYDSAKRFHAESLKILHHIGNRRGLVESLEQLGELAGSQGQAGRAVRLFGFAEELRRALHYPMQACDLTHYEHSVAAIRIALTETVFNRILAEGRAMTLEQAIEYALSPDPSE